MENKRGSEIFLGVIGIATLVVAIIGATFAYFSAVTNSANNAISTTSTTISLNFTDSDGTKLSTNLIPASETVATYGAISKTYVTSTAQQCIDDNKNEICSVYQFTVTNPSKTTAQTISVTLNTVTNEFTNLKYKVYEGAFSTGGTLDSTSTPVISAATLPVSGGSATLDALSQTLTAEQSVTYTMVLWIDETGADQTSNDAGKSFAAGITITSGSGQGVTGVIAGAQA